MPRNKGYAPMRARSSDSPINTSSFTNSPTNSSSAVQNSGQSKVSSTFKVRYPPPAPPPRYTSPPTRAGQFNNSNNPLDQPLLMDRDDPTFTASSDMPLVSSDHLTSSLPLLRRPSDSTSPEVPIDELASNGKGSRDVERRKKLRNKRTEQIFMSRDPTWSSLPEALEEIDETSTAEQVIPKSTNANYRNCISREHSTEQEDIHEKRRIMMSKMKLYRTQGAFTGYRKNSPGSDLMADDNNTVVPSELLKKRRVLLKTLSRVQLTQPRQVWNRESYNNLRGVCSSENLLQGSEIKRSPSLKNPSSSGNLSHPNRKQLVRWHSSSYFPQSHEVDTCESNLNRRRELPQVPVPSSRQSTRVLPSLVRHNSVLVALEDSAGGRTRSTSVRTELSTIQSGSHESNESVF